ncbi:hypothetical protein CTAYLR_000714 [Chrysophaeum taylorii]|uniref:CCT domain-containing protein n=1 Tax=Chrysophaeum taylorii TaxID=2483200 RepID=A0AAD7XLD1_9STRA|nr:hypothetical protein CTAYLR_000714 [Chrysophaeum taylorii]
MLEANERLHYALDRYEQLGEGAELEALDKEQLMRDGVVGFHAQLDHKFGLTQDTTSVAEQASELLSSLSSGRFPLRRRYLEDYDRRDKRYVGAYSPESRRRRIELFNEKRKRRVWTRKVKYDVRKNFADTRMRVKGRFVKKEDEDLLKELLAII